MAWGWSKTRCSPIAVDFGADSLKLLQIIPSNPPQLIAAAAQDVPEDARADPVARQAFFKEALRKLVRDGSFKGRRVICSIPAYQTLVQNLQIARSDDAAGYDAQVHQHLRERMNVDPSRMVVRYFQVGQVVRGGGTKQEVICLAASRDAAMQYIEMARKAKLEVVGMHSEPLAILRAFAHLYRRQGDTERVTCFIDVGGATTKVIITHGTDMAFAKTIHFAGDHFTRQVAQAKSIGFSEARLARRQESSSPQDNEVAEPSMAVATGAAPPPANAGMTTIAAASASGGGADKPVVGGGGGNESDVLDCLLDELQMSVRYHQSTFPDRPIEKLIFLGGESRHVWVCQKIARALRIGAQLGDPIARLVRVNAATETDGVDLQQPQPGWAVPMGLCLSEANL